MSRKTKRKLNMGKFLGVLILIVLIMIGIRIGFKKGNIDKKTYMMDIVNKNISNYLNLITNTKLVKEPPEYGELIADCYIIFNTCVNGFKLGHNFYFYFNKSLSRNFFRNYQKLVKQKNTVFELTDAIEAINEEMHVAHNYVSIELVMEQLEMNELEKRICRSKLNGQKSAEFFEENEDVSQFEYSQALKSVKVKLKQIV